MSPPPPHNPGLFGHIVQLILSALLHLLALSQSALGILLRISNFIFHKKITMEAPSATGTAPSSQPPSRAPSPTLQPPSTPPQALSQVASDSPANFLNLLRERVKLAGNGTFKGPNYNCRVWPSVIPYHVELRYDFHDMKRTIFVLWCADTEGNPTLLSMDKKADAYAQVTKKTKTDQTGVEGILERLKQSSDRPESVLRTMAEAIYARETQKENDAVDSLQERISQMLESTSTGRIADISLEDSKVVAKGVMDGHILISSLSQSKPTELTAPAKSNATETANESAGPSTTKEEQSNKKPGKNAKRNAKKKAAQKAKREAEGMEKGESASIEKAGDTPESK